MTRLEIIRLMEAEASHFDRLSFHAETADERAKAKIQSDTVKALIDDICAYRLVCDEPS